MTESLAAATGGVRAVLIDADGVLQLNPPGWDDDVRSFVPADRADAYTEDLWAAEKAALRGECSFVDVVREVADRWGFTGREDELLAHWRRVEVSDETLAVVRALRALGLACHLVTNQNDVRAAYLRDEVGYGDLLDTVFCSCELGTTKDDPAFFEHVRATLDLPYDALLLVDDGPAYVETAQALGIRAVGWEIPDGVAALRARLAAQGLRLPG